MPQPLTKKALVSCLQWILLLIIAGLFHGASWVYPGWWIGAWLGQAMLVVLAVGSKPRVAFLAGMGVGCIGLGWAFSWAPHALADTMEATWLGARVLFASLICWESLVFGLFAYVVSRLSQHGVNGLWAAPFAWVVAEYWCPRIFPWLLAYSQLEVLPLLQIAEFTGSCGISFAMNFLSMLPAAVFVWRRAADQEAEGWRLLRMAAVCFLGFASFYAWGIWRVEYWQDQMDRAPRLQVGLVQVDPMWVGSEEKLRRFSMAIQDRVDLLCWPESAVGNYSTELSDFTDRDLTRRLSRDSRRSIRPAEGFACDLLAGGKTYRPGAPDTGPYAMTAFLIDPAERIIGRYRKRTLLPFGEYMPFEKQFPQLREWATLEDVIEAGNDARPLVTSQGARIGVVICYEDMLPRNVRATVAAGAEVLVSLINGSAFECPLTLEQHKRLALMRAVEHRRFFVRCSSTGVTCIIAPTGETLSQLEQGTEGTLEHEVKRIDKDTFYNLGGKYFPSLCTVMLIVALIVCRGKTNPSSELDSFDPPLHDPSG